MPGASRSPARRATLPRRMTPRRSASSTIYQEFNLMPNLTVAENVFIGREPGGGCS